MSEQFNREQIDHFLRAIVDGTLSSSDESELTALLQESEAARQYYVEYLDTEVLLNESLGPAKVGGCPTESGETSTGAIAFPNTSEPKSSIFANFSITNGLLLLGITLLLANLIAVFASNGKRIAPIGDSGPSVVAPTLVATTACVWHRSDVPNVGEELEVGEVVDLLEGIAELRVASPRDGVASIRLEGPSSINVQRDGLMELRNGLLTAEFEEGSGEIRIAIPNGLVVLTPSTFVGIDTRGVESQLHVFEGSAQIYSNLNGDSEHMLVVESGECVQLAKRSDGTTAVNRRNADYQHFASARSMSAESLNLNGEYSAAVKRSKPAIYWRFEGGKLVPNEMGPTMNAVLRGEIHWRRSGENLSAEFGSTVHQASFVSTDRWPQKALEEYTIELWIKPSHYHHGAVIGLVSPPDSPKDEFGHAVQIEVLAPYYSSTNHTNTSQFHFLHRSPPGKKGGSRCHSVEPYQVRSWQHVVARKSKDRVDMFVNGVKTQTKEDATTLEAGLKVVIGQLDIDNGRLRPFVGQLDEVAFYERSLTDEEIRNHYSIVRPSRSDQR